MHRFCLLIILLLFSCSNTKTSSRINVGIDPNLPQISSTELSNDVIGYLKDLLLNITKEHKIEFHFVEESSKELTKRLHDENVDIIFSDITPYNFNEEKYDFSKVLIPLGPYPLVRKNSKINNIKDFYNKLIGTQEDDLSFLDLKKYPYWNLKIYDSEILALNDLVNNKVDIAFIRYLTALSYVEDTFYNQLTLLNIPLNKQGYRFISLKNKNSKIIQMINNKLKKDNSLVKKWNLKIR